MLSITVKTMDSQSRQFDIPNMTKIQDLKQIIAPEVNVDASNQRLIYQGRVLEDNFQLTQEHNGKVLHLVQRMPVTITTTPSSATSTTSTSTGAASLGAASMGANNFNPSQLSQMIFQQAMSGLGNLLVGGSISGNMMANPNDPREQIMNFEIDLNGEGGGLAADVARAAATAASSPSTNVNTSTSTTNAQVRPGSGRGHEHRHRPVHSAPRQLLRSVERNVKQLNTVLNQLEAHVASESAVLQEGTGVDEEGTENVFASELEHGERPDEPMDVAGTEINSEIGPSSSANREASDVDRPTSSVSTDSTSTAATSTSSPASCTNHPSLAELATYYGKMLQVQKRLEPFINRMMNFLNTDPAFTSTQAPDYRRTSRTLTLTLQAQQLLAEVQRLLSNVVIPLGRTPPRSMLVRGPPNARHHHHNQGADPRRIHHAIHAGMPPFAPRGAFFPPGVAQVRQGQPPTVFPIPLTRGLQHVRWRAQAPPPASDNRMPSNSSGTGGNSAPAPTSGVPSGPATVFSVQPPSYTVHVNATIQPHILFNVASGSTTSTTTTTTTSSSSSSSRPTSHSAPSQAQQNTPSSAEWPTAGVLPNIPGVQPDVLTNLFRSVARSVQEQFNVGQPSSSQNQVPEDISNIIGQSVFDAVYNQLTGTGQATNASSAGTTASSNTTTTRSSSNRPLSSASSQSTSPDDYQSATSIAATSASSPATPAPVRRLSEIIGHLRTASMLTNFNWDGPSSELLPGVVRTALGQAPDSGNENFLLRLLREISTNLTSREVLSLLQDENTPVLVRMRSVVRDTVTSSFFANSTPTPEELQSVSASVSEGIRQSAIEFFTDARVVADVNIVESNLSLMRHAVKRILEIFLFSDDASYPTELTRHMRYWLSMWVSLNESILRGGRRGLVELVNKYQPLSEGVALLSALERAFNLHEGSTPVDMLLQSLTALYSCNQNEIDQFVLSEPPTAVDSDTGITLDGANETSMESSSSPDDAQSSDQPSRSQKDDVPRSSAGVRKDTDGGKSDENWKKEVPEGWVGTIVADKERQQDMDPQLPFSEAYMAGMPANKRRKVVS